MPNSVEIHTCTPEGEPTKVHLRTASEIQQRLLSQRIVAVLGITLAAATLAVTINSSRPREQVTEVPPMPNYENSTAVDGTPWVGDLPPGTLDRPLNGEFATGPTEEPTLSNLYGS